MGFPANFTWGAAAASYQIEGARNVDGKKDSVWDMFCQKPGAIWNGQDGFTACDHYHLYKEDVALMKEIGLQAYRLSISWPRVMPDGTGEVNPKGMAFYDRLIDELLKNGITPYVTLFHWDYPYALYRRGGWLNDCSPDWFAEYTRVVVEKLSDRVQNWMTLNEPACSVGIGHQEGRHAPGDQLGFKQILQITHNVLLAHGKSVQAIRAYAKTPSRVSLAHVGHTPFPATESPEDVAAARQAAYATYGQHLFNNSWWLDPVYFGCYPEDGLKLFAEWLPEVGPDDMKTISQPVDFLGVNIYQGMAVRAGSNGPELVDHLTGHAKTSYNWPVTPAALYWGPRFLHERYHSPIVITENGLSNADWVALDGHVHDPQRIDFTRRYLQEFRRAGEDGTEILGYFHWSLMDNFEWAEGYKERFGLIYVDYLTQKRILKDSAYWYRDVIACNGENL